MEDIAKANDNEVHLSPELTQLSFEMSKNYFLDYILRDKQGACLPSACKDGSFPHLPPCRQESVHAVPSDSALRREPDVLV